jgi:paraquat-inducible protein B
MANTLFAEPEPESVVKRRKRVKIFFIVLVITAAIGALVVVYGILHGGPAPLL